MKWTIPLLLVTYLGVASGAKILLLMPLGSKSHFTVFEYMAKALAEKGHKVTISAVYPMSKPHPNIEEYKLDFPDTMLDKEYQQNIFKAKNSNFLSLIMNMSSQLSSMCEGMFIHPKIKNLLEDVKKNGKIYDLAMVNGFMSECSFPLVSMASKHIMLLLTTSLPQWIAHAHNIPFPIATLPSLMSSSWPPLSFMERLMNTVATIGFQLFQRFVMLPVMQDISDKYLPEDSPKIGDVINQISFIIANGDDIFAAPQPSMPYLENIGGFHLREAKPLPKEFADFIASAGEHGVVVFALGSFVQSKYLPEEIKQAFLTAFSKLKQKVIWKFEEELPGLPENVKIVKWMPQQDVLGNPNVRLFITHGGRFSLQETTYHGVPVIGLPLFGDHPFNIAVAKRNGYGEELDINNITSEEVYSLMTKVLNDKRYAENAKRLSLRFKDRLLNPIDKAVFWAEYVIRQDGAHFLKNPGATELNFFQYFLLDVFAVLALGLILVILTLFVIVKFAFRVFKRTKQNKDKKNK